MSQTPTHLGRSRSFGFGDRLGLATRGQAAAAAKFGFAPVFAQQSMEELSRTERTPVEVMAAAVGGLDGTGFAGEWGADADQLRTPDDVIYTAAAGFTWFTIAASHLVDNNAEDMQTGELEVAAARLCPAVFPSSEWWREYAGKAFEIHRDFSLTMRKEEVLRCAVKYGRAIAHCVTMAKAVATACAGRPHDLEVSVHGTDSPTTPVDHLFIALELKRQGVHPTSMAVHLIGEFEIGIDFNGDLGGLERSLKHHTAIAMYCGGYKMSVHNGSDKLSAYPIMGRICGELLHVKTSGTSYLEALRVILKTDPTLFNEVKTYSLTRFAEDRKGYLLSTTTEEAREAVAREDAESAMFGERPGRQLLHVTFGSVLKSGKTAAGHSFKSAIIENLDRHADLYAACLEEHFDRHLTLLSKG